jgi:hypothetical protein
MTVLIAQNTKDKIILGADTGCFRNSKKFDFNDHKGFSKIMEVNNLVFSSAGTVAETVNFGLYCQTRKPENSSQLGIQRFFVDFNKWLKDNCIGNCQNIENNYFFVFEKKLFYYGYGAVREILENDFATDGAGFSEAYMAMHLGKSVEEAINLTIEMNVWTSGKAEIVEILKNNTERPKPNLEDKCGIQCKGIKK